jgi:uncharacterized membrane protein YeaQ/YmgE (transglycosylase-associated protein family)
MRLSVLGSKPIGGALALVVTAVAGAAWFGVWFVVAVFIDWLFWPEWVLPYLVPAALIPLLYLPFLAKAVALRLTNDPETGRITLILGIAGAVIATWWLFLWITSGWEPKVSP